MFKRFFAKFAASDTAPIRVSDWHRSRMTQIANEAEAGLGIIHSGQWVVPGFQPVVINEEVWPIPEQVPRTLAWKLHQFAFLPSLIAYDRKMNSTLGSELVSKLIRRWWSIYRNTSRVKTNMAWHDHATALRLSNFLLLRSSTGQADAFLDRICAEHAELLATERFYERGNNHGFDQSLALFEYGHEMGRSELHALAATRIKEEIQTAFAVDGGHVENSTGYHHFGISQVQRANDLSMAYTGKPLETTGLVEKAENILAHMTRPDRKLPHIGDTQDFVVRRLPQPAIDDITLTKSGWSFFRSGWDTKAVHGAFKCGYLSQSHRQDDDLALSLFAHGEEWLIDGGLYAHQPKDPMRIYMRSAHAHGLPYVFGMNATREIATIGRQSRIIQSVSTPEAFEVTGGTRMWAGFEARRTIKFDRLTKSISIRDTISPLTDKARKHALDRSAKGYAVYGTRFLVPADKAVSRSNGKVVIGGTNVALAIETSLPSKIVKGQEQPSLVGWRSTKANAASPAFDISFTTTAEAMDETFALWWV
ncbi:heparinase II/III family protein [Mesorhizobium sp. KR1-2]|uniref:heparinase II/III domain-containing protein n=1 Tax=Mesorhizobium sp. KR1-2 TaxID=3156609 RepID=UPI0032B5A0BF